MPFNLFHRKKQPQQEAPATALQEPTQPAQEVAPEPAVVAQDNPAQEPVPDAAPTVVEQPQEAPAASATVEHPQETPSPAPEPQPQEQPTQEQPAAPTVEEKKQVQAEPANKTYLKAMPLKELSDIEKVKTDVTNGNIIILRITPLASKSIEDVKTAVNDLFQFAESIGGDIARLGEERVVICPKSIRIWREKTPAPVPSNQPISTAA
ncbi:MAG: cell division protein SepF [Candidatus Bathyarchaeota archaeon]|nr:cell division protein SepF [Candidatus Bathyarchaeota archaeon]